MRILESRFLCEDPPWRDAHAASIAWTPDGLVAAWFAGSREGRPDVAIWLARFENGRWSEPVRGFSGRDGAGRPQPCWNPVLFRSATGRLLLFYKVGPRPRRWWGMLSVSRDEGRGWSRPRRLPDGIFGPVKNKPLELSPGVLLCGSSSEFFGWRCQIERTDDLGESWRRPIVLNHPFKRFPGGFAANQATLLDLGGGRLRALCRTKQGFIAECRSADGGWTWSRMRPTAIPHPNSAFDVERLADGRILLVHHPGTEGRSALLASISEDGERFAPALVLEDEPGQEFSYPFLLRTPDGLVHLVYSWKRRTIRHLVLEPGR
ncbi:MAG: sialidase family protein [Geminicoccaceae bacterium]|nr:exo-alpha-sialidase [Geminicoccaceae bacterium]MDW8125282.1 sialidase family protein [Geminicoccaceae bacterium]MDW8340466.1 sialidase family protein [Geminicoccaceae bacterium]